MIADQMRKLFAYNQWAWQRVFPSVQGLSVDQYHGRQSLFGPSSVHEVLVHCFTAESIWLDRCQGESPIAMFDPQDYADFTAVLTPWKEVVHQWANFVQWLSDEDCQRTIDYRNTRGDEFTLQLMDILQHVANHATEHRSQLTPWLFELGVPTPSLDFMLFRLRP